MKKLVATFLVLVLALMGIGFAEEDSGIQFDFSNMGVDELYSVIDDINIELANRGALVELHPGSYHVGTDLPAGRYLIFGYDDVNNSNHWTIAVWKTETSKSEAEKAYNQWTKAYNQAKENKQAGLDYEYPEDLNESDYGEDYYLDSGDSLSLALVDGQVLEVTDSTRGGGTLIIVKSSPLFSD